jgi:Flp pilus assembly protein TadG
MRRLSDEEGAVAVIVAIVMMLLVGIAALAIDVGNLYWERRQLQNAADAGALAAAQDLVDGEGDATAYATARQYADANNSRGAFVRPASDPDPGFVVEPNSVTVTARTGAYASEGTLDSLFAGVLGFETYATLASATASWGTLGSADTIPLTFSVCEWNQMTGGDVDNLPTEDRTVYFHSTQTAKDINTCGGPANQDHPGGFGWLSPEGGKCQAYIEDGEVNTDTGNNVPNVCTGAYLTSLIGKTVAMPIFSKVEMQGSKATYTIVGFAAFEMSGFHLSGNKAYHYPVDNPPCGGNDRCISGSFVSYWDIGSAPTFEGGQDFGAYMIGLTK